MTDVERLTIPHAGHERKRTQYGDTAYWTQASKFDMMNRLGEYEDTGYSPEELRGILRKAKVAPGDRVEYAGGVWEVAGFDMNAVVLKNTSEDRRHIVDQLLFMFRADYAIIEGGGKP